MPLAHTLGVCLLLLWPRASVVPSVTAMPVWEVTGPQENQSTDSSPQSSSTQAPAEPQKKPAGGTDQPCPKNSQPASGTKAGCKPAASTAKQKKNQQAQPAAAPADSPPKTPPPPKVVRNGGTDEPDVNLSPGPNPQTPQQREATDKLLAASDVNLTKISGRSLSADEQETVKQIKSYMEQAKTAAETGDVQRAYNLAVKANLLSAELAKGH
jgi:hypothetical protein